MNGPAGRQARIKNEHMFIEFGIKDVVDIVLVAALLFGTWRLLRGTNAVNVFVGVIAFVFCWFLVSFVFKMQLFGSILDKVMSVGAIALIVLFKDEIRSFFSLIGTQRRLRYLRWFYDKTGSKADTYLNEASIKALVQACRDMSKNKEGALIVVEESAGLDMYIRTGEEVDAKLSSRLVENIFFKNSPLHDGAMIIKENRVAACGCILPVSKSTSLPSQFGLRHRSALGLSEQTDALVIVVSEQTGEISVMKDGAARANVTAEELSNVLSEQIRL